ncbi:ABC transporter permease [Tuwongella immobilis]
MDTYRQILGIDPREQVNLGLIQLESPEQLATCLPRLQAEMPPDVQILSRDELFTKEQRHWIQGTSIGIIFVLGVLVAFVVGVVFVYQVMSSDITSRLGEFATLKAMGYTNGFIGRVVLQQAAFLAILSYLISLVLAVGLYELTRQLAGLPMQMTWQILVMVLLLGLGMCSLSGLIALQKVRRADPADLF